MSHNVGNQRLTGALGMRGIRETVTEETNSGHEKEETREKC